MAISQSVKRFEVAATIAVLIVGMLGFYGGMLFERTSNAGASSVASGISGEYFQTAMGRSVVRTVANDVAANVKAGKTFPVSLDEGFEFIPTAHAGSAGGGGYTSPGIVQKAIDGFLEGILGCNTDSGCMTGKVNIKIKGKATVGGNPTDGYTLDVNLSVTGTVDVTWVASCEPYSTQSLKTNVNTTANFSVPLGNSLPTGITGGMTIDISGEYSRTYPPIDKDKCCKAKPIEATAPATAVN